MSDVTTGSVFNPQFFMNPPWWIGRVEEKGTWSPNIQGENFDSVLEIEGWGHRYKVRIFNWHTGDLDKLPPEQMAFCQVVMPVTAGSGHGSATITPGIESGSVVFGFFMDGMSGQEAYILGVLGNSNNNVPEKRGQGATNANAPTPATGVGSLANVPVPANVDRLSTPQLLRLLNPAQTPSAATSRAASEARQRYISQQQSRGLPVSAAEAERQALIATVRSSRQPGAAAGAQGNCNLGYQQFNDTFDRNGDPLRAAKVPDDRVVSGQVLSITEAQHIRTEAKKQQESNAKVKIPLADVCKKSSSEVKGIQLTLENLLNGVEELKRQFNQRSAFSPNVFGFSNQIEILVKGAIYTMANFTKNIIEDIRAFILRQLSDSMKPIIGLLMPSEVPRISRGVENSKRIINCVVNNIVEGLRELFARLVSRVLDRYINGSLSAAERLIGNVVGNIIGPITRGLQAVSSVISGGLGGLANVFGGGGAVFDALQFLPGILKFFFCNDDQDCVEYNKISQGGPALPGGGPNARGSRSINANIANNAKAVENNFLNNNTNTIRSGIEVLSGNTA